MSAEDNSSRGEIKEGRSPDISCDDKPACSLLCPQTQKARGGGRAWNRRKQAFDEVHDVWNFNEWRWKGQMVTITHVDRTQIRGSVPGLLRSHLQAFIKEGHPPGARSWPTSVQKVAPWMCVNSVMQHLHKTPTATLTGQVLLLKIVVAIFKFNRQQVWQVLIKVALSDTYSQLDSLCSFHMFPCMCPCAHVPHRISAVYLYIFMLSDRIFQFHSSTSL